MALIVNGHRFGDDRNVLLRNPKHRVRTIGSRDEDELWALAYRIQLQVDEMLRSGKLKLSKYNVENNGTDAWLYEDDE